MANFLSSALYAVLASAGLQFVGLGNINDQSWGTMLYWAQNNEALATGLPLWALAPGVAIAILGSGLALLNYAFDEVANPALRPVRATKSTGRKQAASRLRAACAPRRRGRSRRERDPLGARPLRGVRDRPRPGAGRRAR